MAGNDVYLNVVGGLRINEPAADLAVAAALLSSSTGTPLPEETVFFGEVGLSGEVRAVSQPDARLKEAAKLGFSRAIMPARRSGTARGRTSRGKEPLEINEITHVRDLADLVGGMNTVTPEGHRR